MKISRITAGCAQRLLVAANNRRNNDTYVLMLHEVTDGEKPQFPNVSITKDNFVKLLNSLIEDKVLFDSVDRLYTEAGKRVIITFDDVFKSAVENAFPLLDERKIPYVAFITTEYVGAPGYIMEESLQKLKDNPLCTIGFHANKHVLMRNLTNQQIKENTNPRDFETTYGVKCNYFAFPYGSVYACPRRAIAVTKQQGYRAVFSTIGSAVCSRRLNKIAGFIPRLCVSDNSWESVLTKVRRGKQ